MSERGGGKIGECCGRVFKMCTMLRRRKPLQGDMGQDLSVSVFGRYSKDGKMGADGLLSFLQTEQGDAISTLEDVKRLMEKFRKDLSSGFFAKVKEQLTSSDFSKDDFFNYLLSPTYNSCLPTAVRSAFPFLPPSVLVWVGDLGFVCLRGSNLVTGLHSFRILPSVDGESLL